MATPAVEYFQPARNVTARATTDLVAARLAWYATPPTGSDQVYHAQAEKPSGAGQQPAGLVRFDVSAGDGASLAKLGTYGVEASSEASPGQAAYAAADGTVTAAPGGGEDSEGNPLVGSFVRPATEGSRAVVSLNIV